MNLAPDDIILTVASYSSVMVNVDSVSGMSQNVLKCFLIIITKHAPTNISCQTTSTTKSFLSIASLQVQRIESVNQNIIIKDDYFDIENMYDFLNKQVIFSSLSKII